jgi:hypothetical protein
MNYLVQQWQFGKVWGKKKQQQQQWKHKVNTLNLVAQAKTHDQILVTFHFKSNLNLFMWFFHSMKSHHTFKG